MDQLNHNHQQQTVHDIPNDLKHLIRIIMRTFYNFELYLIMEMLMMYPCIKEDDLAELLRLELKTVQQYLKNLKKEKFISEKFLLETSQDGNKQCKHNYFYVNYKMTVNVIKYKLDKIRQQIEMEDKQFSSRAQFKCSQCHKTYTDLDTKDIFLTMRCIYCGADIDEDTSSMPSRSSRNLIHTFNTQMAIIFELLSKVEHVQLANHLLNPDVLDMTYILDRIRMQNQPLANGANANGHNNNNGKLDRNGSSQNLTGRAAMLKYEKWSGDKTRNIDLLQQTKVSINFDSVDGGSNQQQKKKELPSILLLNRTQEDYSETTANRDSILLSQIKQAADETLNNSSSANLAAANSISSTENASTSEQNARLKQPTIVSSLPSIGNGSTANLEQNIMQLLLKHEKKSLNAALQNQNSTQSSNSLAHSDYSNNSVSVSSPLSTINSFKKRNLDSNFVYENEMHNNGNHNHLKKRKLNNGDIGVSFKRNYSDGSDNSDEYEYENEREENEIDTDQEDELNFDDKQDLFDKTTDDYLIPRVTVQNRSIRFDRITPKLINKMNENEKETYINICRQLYTEIYEI